VRKRLNLLAVLVVVVAQFAAVSPIASAVGTVPRLDWVANLADDEVFANALAIDANGNTYVAGQFSGTVDFDASGSTFELTASGGDAYVTKLDPDGAFVWAAMFTGSGTESAYGVAVDGSGNVTVVGRFNSETDFDPGAGTSTMTPSGGYDGFVVGLDSNGAFVWKEQFGSTSDDIVNAVAASPDGTVFGAWTLGPFPTNDASVFARTSTGGVVWDYDIAADGYQTANAIAVRDGAVVVAGEFGSGEAVDFDDGAGTFELTPSAVDVYVVRLNLAGVFDWALKMGGDNNQTPFGIAIGTDGRIAVTGDTNGLDQDFDPGAGVFELDSGGLSDPFFAAVDIDGALITAGVFSGAADGQVHSVAFDSANGLLLTGWFIGTTDFDPGAGTSELTSAGAKDVFVARVTSSGTLDWASQIGDTGNDEGTGVVVGAADAAVFAGHFLLADVDLDPSDGTAERSSGSSFDYYVVKMIEQCQGMNATLVGSAGGDFLNGTSGPDVIVGLGGNDILLGGGGDDVICGGPGNDKIEGGPGDDSIDGGEGIDTIDYSASSGPVTVDLGAGSGTDPDGTDALDAVENVFGSSFDDVLVGDSGPNRLYGFDGDDHLSGKSGKDRLYGADGDDTLDGGSSKDRLYGGSGHDELSGGSNDDTLLGGSASDLLIGGKGDDTLEGQGGADTLRGGLGDDYLDGGPGNDSADGQADFDTCIAETVANCEA